MRKIRSFIVAVVLMAVFVTSAHLITGGMSMKIEDEGFGFWFNPYKDLSYSALSENMDPDTVLVMGSSEFRHGRDSKYHPRNTLRNAGVNLMMIGGPCNQILYHSIAMGSLEPQLESRKVILLVSPTWFKKNGVSAVNYGVRFSESEYIHFMENQNIDDEIKQYVAKRSEELLADNTKYNTEVGIIDSYLADGNNSFIREMLFNVVDFMATDRDRISSAFVLKLLGNNEEPVESPDSLSSKAFDKMEKRAAKASDELSDNPFDISDYSWNRTLRKTYRTDKDAYPNRICSDSPEFDDLEAFLKICKQTGIQAKLIVMPVNGKWFDYIGTGEEKRRKTTDKILKMAEEYGAETADLTVHEYDPYITTDATHPWKKGWVLIDREIYNFCVEDGKGQE